MPINASYEYFAAEKKYLAAQTLDQKIACLEEMIRTAPKHKSSENFVAELKTRLKKFLEKKEKGKKIGKATKKGIKKEGFQIALVGLTNSGKSSLLSILTNANPKINSYPYTTTKPELGTLYHQGIQIQIVDLPSIGSENFDIGISNNTDCIILVLSNLGELEKINPFLQKATGKKIIAINKSDLLTNEELRKLNEKIKSKKLNAVLISCKNLYGIEELKDKILESTNLIRVYTKEPGKIKSPNPLALPVGATVKDVAESILKGFSLKVKETRLTGPSGKFPNQKVGLQHVLKDQDTIEFHT